MNCKELEAVMAEALGGELDESRRAAMEAHLAECDRCRGEFESLGGTVRLIRRLSGPEAATLADVGGRLELIPADRPRAAAGAPPSLAARRWTGGAFRAAAGLAIAFLAGYVVRDVQEPVKAPEHVVSLDTPTGSAGGLDVASAAPDSVRRAFLEARTRHAGGSDLARCLIAVAGHRR